MNLENNQPTDQEKPITKRDVPWYYRPRTLAVVGVAIVCGLLWLTFDPSVLFRPGLLETAVGVIMAFCLKRFYVGVMLREVMRQVRESMLDTSVMKRLSVQFYNDLLSKDQWSMVGVTFAVFIVIVIIMMSIEAQFPYLRWPLASFDVVRVHKEAMPPFISAFFIHWVVMIYTIGFSIARWYDSLPD